MLLSFILLITPLQGVPSDSCIATSKSIHVSLMPCAWNAARETFSKRFPQWKEQVYKIKPPKIKLKKRPWFDKAEGSIVYGEYDRRKRVPITIGISGDIEQDYDTMLHEMYHYIGDKLPVYPLTKMVIGWWVDMVDK